MKKKIAFLFAAVMLVLAGCGSKVNDHVVDYKVDLPDGFVESEAEGADAYWYNPADYSNVNVTIVDKDQAAATNISFKTVTADMLREMLASSMKDTYGADVEISDRYFTKDSVCGLDAYQYSYNMDLMGEAVTQIIVGVNADKTYTFTYTTSNDGLVAAFDESAKNIQLTLE